MSETVNPVVARAMALIDVDRCTQAQEILSGHLATFPDDARAWERLSVCRFEARDWSGAVRAADEALRLSPEFVDAHLRRSEAFRVCGWAKQAVEAAREGVRLLPEDPAPRVVLSHALRKLPEQEGLQEAYDTALEAIRLDPERVGAHFALYFAAYDMGRKDLAAQAMDQVLSFDPGNAAARTNLAALRTEDPNGDLFAATEDLAAALTVQPDSWHARHNLDVVARKLLKQARWPALASLVIAMATAVAGDTAPEGQGLGPSIPLGAQAVGLGAIVAMWAWCVLLTLRKLPRSVRGYLLRLPRRVPALKVMAGGVLWCVLCAVLLLTFPYGPQWFVGVFLNSGWVGLVGCMIYSARSKRLRTRG
ncbi:tetratricopeptide repeat protein [Streptomyces sp. HU2014]|uniref:tetratricopeptide repeat protein n=1 Tax=Streptomyces sp. HU2014 TaxID=2939414 RepID=UPI00200BBCD9|nr:tetratricopeptide repeat protein [Streptomyces sp. HU2014]UQI43753.1 tetratricopeptide repeat protein [Streptomyces sp. HU2014]